MGEVQSFFAGWMSALVGYLPIGYAFGAGMMASVNPCGFPMLPLYLTLYIGTQDEGFARKSPWRRLLHGMGVALVVSSGFVVLFGLFGMSIALGARFLTEVIPWIAVAIGGALVLLGGWMLAGRHFSSTFFLKLSQRLGGPNQSGMRGFFLYGLAYGICSLSCTLPVFLIVVGSAAAAGSFAGSLAQFVSYSAGMATVIFVLTASLALFKEGVLLAGIRRLSPYMHYGSATLVLLAGSYLIYYWLFKPGTGLLGA
ncbi:MAG: cytochrome c biogenesis protein CcdA [bacterium]